MTPVKIVDKTQAQLIADRRADRAEMLAAVAEKTMIARLQLDKLTELIGGGRSMNVQIKRLHPEAVVPRYAKPGDSGFDLVAVEDVIIAPGATKTVPIGLAFEIPEEFELQVRPRSGVTKNTKLRVQLGTIDSGYRGEVAVIVDNVSPDCAGVAAFALDIAGSPTEAPVRGLLPYGTYIIRKGDRIAQGVIALAERATFVVVAELSDSERGAGGFGHTGTNV